MKKARIIAVSTAVLALLGVFLFTPKVAKQARAAKPQAFAECISKAAAPVCQSAQYGIVTIAASASTVVVATSAVTTNAIIDLTYDASTNTGTLLGVTCNTSAQQPYVSARSPGVSFTIATGSTFSANPGCIQWDMVTQ